MLEPVILGEYRKLLSGLDLPGDGIPSEAGHVSLVKFTQIGIILDDPVSDLESRIDQLDSVLGTLQHRFPANLDKLIDVSETGGRLAGGDRVTDPVGVYASALPLEISDKIFIQRVGGEYLAFRHSVAVKDFTHLLGKVGEVSTVQAYPVARGIVVVDTAFPERAYRIEYTALEGVVGVDQKDEVLSFVGIAIIHESLVLSLHGTPIGGHETVRHRAGGRDIVQDSVKDIGRAGAAGDDGGFCPVGRGPRAMCPARAELADGLVGSPADPRGLGRHCHLVVHYAEEGSLEYLCLDQGRFYGDDRLVREYDLTFAHRPYVSGEPHGGEIFTELGVVISREEFLKEGRLRFPKVQDAFDNLLGAAAHGPVVVFRGFAVEHVEHGRDVLTPGLEEGLSHSVLVLVRAVGII